MAMLVARFVMDRRIIRAGVDRRDGTKMLTIAVTALVVIILGLMLFVDPRDDQRVGATGT